MDDAEKRFSHLLKPIRDLAENWNIDVASELLDYLEDLDEISINLEEGSSNLNFAEAALIIQGSAMVYSKKVEFLYSLVFETLRLVCDNGTEQNDRNNRSSISSRRGANQDVFEDEEPEFLLLDDTIQTSENIDLHPNKHGKKLVGMSVSMPYSLLSNKPDITSNLGALKTLSCEVHATGAILLDGQDENRFGDSIKKQMAFPLKSVDENDQKPQQLNFDIAMDATNESLNKTEPEQCNEDDGFSDYGGGFDMGGGDDDYPSDAENNSNMAEGNTETQIVHQQTISADNTRRTSVASFENQDDFDDEDPWERLDPHEPSHTKDKPFKKGKTYVVPKVLDNKESKKSESPKTKQLDRFANKLDFWERNIPRLDDGLNLQKLGYGKLFFQEFTYAQKERIKAMRVNALENAKRIRLEMERGNLELAEEETENQPKWASNAIEGDAPQNIDEYDDDDGGGFFYGGGDSDDDMGDDAMDESETEIRKFDLSASTLDTVPDSYVDLVRVHVEKYLQSANDWASDTSLHKRVKDWQDKLEPVLDEQNLHPPFDIHNYGDIILGNLVENLTQGEEDEEYGWDFTEVAAALGDASFEHHEEQTSENVKEPQGVKNHELTQFEVCRLFLASLQLANNGNVELSHHEASMDDDLDHEGATTNWFFKVKLLNSKTMDKQLKGYLAPSVQEDELQQESSNKHKKNKPVTGEPSRKKKPLKPSN